MTECATVSLVLRNQPVIIEGREIRLRQVARELQMDPAYLSRVLSGRIDPESLRVHVARRIAKALRLPTIDRLISAIRARQTVRAA